MLGLLKTGPWLRAFRNPPSRGRSTALPDRLGVLLAPMPGRVCPVLRELVPGRGQQCAAGGHHG